MSPKEEALEILGDLADDVSWETIQYHLYVRQKIENSLKRAEEGKVLTQEEAEKRMSRWLVEE